MPFVPFVPFASAVALEVLLPVWLAWEVVVEVNCSASAGLVGLGDCGRSTMWFCHC